MFQNDQAFSHPIKQKDACSNDSKIKKGVSYWWYAYFQIELSDESFRTVHALKLSLASMEVQMLRQVRALRKALSASFYRTLKGLFPGMNSEMIEEVTSFPELLAAALVLALHHSSHSLCNCMFELKYLIMSSIRNMLAFADAMESLGVSEPIPFSNNIVSCDIERSFGRALL